MPSYVPRSLEPYKKREILEKREQELMHALKTGFDPLKINRAAEKVRAAQLAVLKAKDDLIDYQPETEQKIHQRSNIERERTSWLNISTEDIAVEYENKQA
jgi:hypothetical protein